MRYLSAGRPLLALLLALMLAANGIAMLANPQSWYLGVPGVAATGPLNLHFVRDIGCAFLVAAGGLLWLQLDARAWPAAIAGSAFLALHALVHAGEMAFIHFDLRHLLRDLPGVFLPPVIALWLSWPRPVLKEKNHAQMDRTAASRRV